MNIQVWCLSSSERQWEGGDLAVIWLDLTNACGSIPPKLVEVILERYHVPPKVKQFILDYYSKFSVSLCRHTVF